jgi:hypothetical protein
MRESRSYGSVGEPVGNHRLYPEEAGGAIPPADPIMPIAHVAHRLPLSK